MTDHFRPDSVITLLRNTHLDRGMPRVLSFQDTETLTAPLGCDAGELFALWDGTGLAVKRVEPHPEDKALRLHCTNPAWPRYSRPDDDVHIVSARCCGRSPACEPQRPLGRRSHRRDAFAATTAPRA